MAGPNRGGKRKPRTREATGRRPSIFHKPKVSSRLHPSAGNRSNGNDLRTYAILCKDVQDGPLAAKLQLSEASDGGSMVHEVLRDLLEENTKIIRDVGTTIDSRLLDRVILLDNRSTEGDALGRAGSLVKRARGKRSSVHMSSRKHRRLGSYNLPMEYCKYALYKPMQEMWKEYAAALVAECRDSVGLLQSVLLSADLHGATVAVVDSKHSSTVGTQGIMVRETDNTFGIVTCEDKLCVIPKQGSIFMFQLEDLRVTLFGNGLSSRSLTTSKEQRERRDSCQGSNH